MPALWRWAEVHPFITESDSLITAREAAYPRTMRVFDALLALLAFDAAQPSRQPDAARAAT